MEEQYGEHYAQKVEDRLLHYLQQLEAVLPGDTHIDKVCVLWQLMVNVCSLWARAQSALQRELVDEMHTML